MDIQEPEHDQPPLEPESELKSAQNALKELGAVHQSSIPYQLNKTITLTALTFLKHQDTPERYPRKTGLQRKRPL